MYTLKVKKVKTRGGHLSPGRPALSSEGQGSWSPQLRSSTFSQWNCTLMQIEKCSVLLNISVSSDVIVEIGMNLPNIEIQIKLCTVVRK
jgi:hypothetical protein